MVNTLQIKLLSDNAAKPKLADKERVDEIRISILDLVKKCSRTI